MKFKKKKTIIFFIFFILLLGVFFKLSLSLINNTSGISQKIKYFVPQSVRDILRDTLYKSKYLEIKNSKLESNYNKIIENIITLKKKKLTELSLENIQTIKGNSLSLKKYDYPYLDHFSWGKKPPGYISSYRDFIFVMSGSGEIIYFKKSETDNNQINFQTLETNFHSYIDIEQYYKRSLFGIRDIEVIGDELFVSYVDPDSCNKLSILRGKINYDYIYFKKFFSYEGCKNDFQGQDNEGLDNSNKDTSFIGQRSGGRIVKFKNSNILFSIGDHSLTLFPPEAQNLKSFFGSLIKINLENGQTSILAKGLRNPQGLYFDQVNNLILVTDHGPDGGDEINIFDLEKEKFNNYGWPVASYGVHYKSTIDKAKKLGNLDLLKKGAPLKKSHEKNGFKEPLMHWSPSIGVSEVVKIPDLVGNKQNKEFLIAGMGNVIAEGDMTLHHIRLSNQDNNETVFHDKIVIKERIRDFYFDSDLNKFVLLLGTTPSIGFLEFND